MKCDHCDDRPGILIGGLCPSCHSQRAETEKRRAMVRLREIDAMELALQGIDCTVSATIVEEYEGLPQVEIDNRQLAHELYQAGFRMESLT